MGVHYLINHIHYPVHVPPRGTTIQSISFAAIHNHLKGVPCKWYHLENPKINNNIVQKSKWQFLQPTPIQPVEFNFGYNWMYVDLTGRTRKRATNDCPKWCGDFINKILLSSRRCYYYYWFHPVVPCPGHDPSIPLPAHTGPKELAARRSRINNPEYRNITSVFI